MASRNPVRDDYDDSLPEPDEASWRLIRLKVAHRDGGEVEIEWLRPVEWLEAHNLSLGARVATTLPEIGVQAEALVTTLEPWQRGVVGERIADCSVSGSAAQWP